MKIFFSIFCILYSFSALAGQIDNFSLQEYKTKHIVDLEEIVKTKKVVINFWASWCTSCIQELSILEKLKEDNPNVVFIAINAGERTKKIKRFLKKYKFSYRVLIDNNKKYTKSIGVLSLPQTFVIGKNREILYKGEVPPTKI